MSDPISQLQDVFTDGHRKAMSVPADWKHVASTFEGEALKIVLDIPEADIAIVSTTYVSREPEAVRMTFFLSPAGINRIIAASAAS